jgi:hypothetical protein
MSTAVSAEQPQQPIGAASLNDIKRAYGGTIRVVSGSDFTETVDFSGQCYVFPPRGTCVINDIEDYPWAQTADGKRRRVWGQKEIIEAAASVAYRLCSDEQYGRKGFMVLLGDGQDEERKLVARRRWVAFYEDYCRQQESLWVAKVTAFRAANPSGIPPRQPRAVKMCQDWLSKLDHGLVDLGDGRGASPAIQAPAICGYCSAEFPDEESAKRHVEARHPAAAADTEAVITPRTIEATKRTADGKKDDGETAAAFVLKKAKALCVPVSADEMEALVLEDEAVISELTHRIAKAAAGAPAEASEKRQAAAARGRRR